MAKKTKEKKSPLGKAVLGGRGKGVEKPATIKKLIGKPAKKKQ